MTTMPTSARRQRSRDGGPTSAARSANRPRKQPRLVPSDIRGHTGHKGAEVHVCQALTQGQNRESDDSEGDIDGRRQTASSTPRIAPVRSTASGWTQIGPIRTWARREMAMTLAPMTRSSQPCRSAARIPRPASETPCRRLPSGQCPGQFHATSSAAAAAA